MITWPKRTEVHTALKRWAEVLAQHHPEILAVGYFGSYAKGTYGVGSDLDLIVITRDTSPPGERHRWPLEDLPVPAEAVVLTLAEWRTLPQRAPRFARVLREESVWVWPTASPPALAAE